MIDIIRGDTCYLIFSIHTALDADGNPLSDLSGIAFRLQARLDADADSTVFEKSTASGSISVSGMSVRVRIDGSDTSALVPGTILLADLQAETGGRVFTVDAGEQPLRLRVVADVTR